MSYQTNPMAYGPDDYEFSGVHRGGAPVHLLLAAVATLGTWAD